MRWPLRRRSTNDLADDLTAELHASLVPLCLTFDPPAGINVVCCRCKLVVSLYPHPDTGAIPLLNAIGVAAEHLRRSTGPGACIPAR